MTRKLLLAGMHAGVSRAMAFYQVRLGNERTLIGLFDLHALTGDYNKEGIL